MAQSDRLALPLLAAGQAQKELTHNEALSRLDMIVQLTVESADLTVPPVTPLNGQCWIVATGGTGAWSGKDGAIVAWTANGWLFATPKAGWRGWVRDRGNNLRFIGSSWIDDPVRADGLYLGGARVLTTRQSAIPTPVGGSVHDDEARTAISAILSALRAHGLIAP